MNDRPAWETRGDGKRGGCEGNAVTPPLTNTKVLQLRLKQQLPNPPLTPSHTNRDPHQSTPTNKLIPHSTKPQCKPPAQTKPTQPPPSPHFPKLKPRASPPASQARMAPIRLTNNHLPVPPRKSSPPTARLTLHLSF